MAPGVPTVSPVHRFIHLSDREMEVLSCVVRGMSNKEIARLLGISHQTVKNHVTSILRKFGVEDRTQAVVYALKRGWVKLQRRSGEESGVVYMATDIVTSTGGELDFQTELEEDRKIDCVK
jgi:DNA-binding CsgD family transcriptional regulator